MVKLRSDYDLASRKYGFVDEKGKIVVPYVYDKIADKWSEGLIYVDRGKWKGFLDENADEVLSLDFYQIKNLSKAFFKHGLCQVSRIVGGRTCYGYIDKQRREVIPVVYERCEMVTSEAFLIEWQSVPIVMFKNGKMISLEKYSKVGMVLENGLITVCEEGKYGLVRWGCVDCYGNMMFPAVCDEVITGWRCGKPTVIKNKVLGTVDKNGVFQPLPTNKYEYKPEKDAFDKFAEGLEKAAHIAHFIQKIFGL